MTYGEPIVGILEKLNCIIMEEHYFMSGCPTIHEEYTKLQEKHRSGMIEEFSTGQDKVRLLTKIRKSQEIYCWIMAIKSNFC